MPLLTSLKVWKPIGVDVISKILKLFIILYFIIIGIE